MSYEENALIEAKKWAEKMKKKPSLWDQASKGVQNRVNQWIPVSVHQAITSAMKQMSMIVMTGSEWTTQKPIADVPFRSRELLVEETINFYKKSASLSGAGTGAGGIFLGLADFPILLSFKFKMLFEIMNTYGFDVRKPEERLFILYVFQIAFSSSKSRLNLMSVIEDWDGFVKGLEIDLEHTDWQTWQQEYRDYIDLAKMFQLVPGIGMVVGAVANYHLVDELGTAAKNACRLRLLNK